MICAADRLGGHGRYPDVERNQVPDDEGIPGQFIIAGLHGILPVLLTKFELSL